MVVVVHARAHSALQNNSFMLNIEHFIALQVEAIDAKRRSCLLLTVLVALWKAAGYRHTCVNSRRCTS